MDSYSLILKVRGNIVLSREGIGSREGNAGSGFLYSQDEVSGLSRDMQAGSDFLPLKGVSSLKRDLIRDSTFIWL